MTLVCAAAILIGFGPVLTDAEAKVRDTAQAGCRKYFPEAPCLKVLTKKPNSNYQVICGKPE